MDYIYFITYYYITTMAYVISMKVPNNGPCLLEDSAVKRFREFVQIDTSKKENIDEAVNFWRRQAEQTGAEFSLYTEESEPVCVLTWPGTNSALPSIMLNAHMDVVPADLVQWSHPPYAAHVDKNCDIYGRGTQDSKDIAIQYLEAMSRLTKNNVTLLRTVHITLMPDEETGGFKGMRPFIKSKAFKDLNVAFALDEGFSSSGDHLYVTYQDRRVWVMNFTVTGTGGHGFIMPSNIAIKKLLNLLNTMMEFRQPLEDAVSTKSLLEYGSYTTLNINMIHGGVASNIIPEQFYLIADLRLAPSANAMEIQSLINSWLATSEHGIKVDYLRQEMDSLQTALDDTNPFWEPMKRAIKDMGFSVRTMVNPATSDLIFVRNEGIPALGFAPKFRTTSKIHAANEYINVHTFLRGIDVYEAIIRNIANVIP